MVAFAPLALDQTMSIEQRVDGAAGGNLNLTGKATQQAFADLACAPVGFLPFEVEDGGLHLLGQLVAVTPRPARTVGQSFQTGFLVAVKDLVTGLARDSELSTEGRHFLVFHWTFFLEDRYSPRFWCNSTLRRTARKKSHSKNAPFGEDSAKIGINGTPGTCNIYTVR